MKQLNLYKNTVLCIIIRDIQVTVQRHQYLAVRSPQTCAPLPPPGAGRVQARLRAVGGGPEERRAHPPRPGHARHRLQQEAQRAEAQDVGLEGVPAPSTVSLASTSTTSTAATATITTTPPYSSVSTLVKVL